MALISFHEYSRPKNLLELRVFAALNCDLEGDWLNPAPDLNAGEYRCRYALEKAPGPNNRLKYSNPLKVVREDKAVYIVRIGISTGKEVKLCGYELIPSSKNKNTMTDFKMVPLEEIQPDPNQPRKFYDETAMDELIDSVREKDVLQPVLLRPIGCSEAYREKDPAAKMDIEIRRAAGYTGPVYLIVCGERRYRAAKAVMAAIKSRNTIPAVIRELTDEEALELQIIENLQRKDVHPMEEAVAFQSLLEKGKDITEIANRVGKSVFYARQRVKLCNLSKEWQEAFFKGRLENINDALTIATFDPKIQKELLKDESHYTGKISFNNWKLRQYRGDLAKAPFSLDDNTLDKKAGPCTTCKFNTAAANLFPDAIDNPKCTNVSCFKHKCDVHFDVALADAKKDPLIIFVNTDYSDIPNNNKILAGLVKEGYQVLNGRMKCGFREIEPPDFPDKEDYEYEDNSVEENQAAYEEAVAEYKKDMAEYEKKVSSGKYKKAFSIHGDKKGHYVFLEIGKSSSTTGSAGSSALTKEKEAAGKLTAQDITDEIKRIQDREKRAKEIDINKNHKAILDVLDKKKSAVRNLPWQGTVDRGIMVYILLHEATGFHSHQAIEKHIKGLPKEPPYGKVGYAFDYFKALAALSDDQLAVIVRSIVFDKWGSVNFQNDVHDEDTTIRQIAEYAGIDIAAIEAEQAAAATKRKERVDKRISELQEKKKELGKPAKKSNGKVEKSIKALVKEKPSKKNGKQ